MPVAPRAVIASRSDDAFEHVGPAGNAAVVAAVVAPVVADGVALCDPAAFRLCLATPALVRNGAFALHLCSTPDDPVATSSAWRLGLVIPKRYEASAVARNTIKRRWRAAFRRGRDAWAGEFGAADVVVRMHSPLVKKSEAAAAGPAKVRARERFDPQAMFESLAARLRGRRRVASGPSLAAVGSP